MALHTVTVSLTSYFQNLSPYAGTIRVRLNRPVVTSDGLVVPLEWQSVDFTNSGDVSIQLVPNAMLGADTCYNFEVYRKTAGSMSRTTMMERGSMFVPDQDCDMLSIAVVAQSPAREMAGTAQGYASQAKQILDSVKVYVDGFDERVEAARDQIDDYTDDAIQLVENAGVQVSDQIEQTSGPIIAQITGAADQVSQDKSTVVAAKTATLQAVDQLAQQRYLDKAEVLTSFAQMSNAFNRHLIDIAGGVIDG